MWNRPHPNFENMLTKEINVQTQQQGQFAESVPSSHVKLVSAIFYQIFIFSPNDICRCNFWNNSKTALHYIIELGQIIYNE